MIALRNLINLPGSSLVTSEASPRRAAAMRWGEKSQSVVPETNISVVL
jgi:hypothetical protein